MKTIIAIPCMDMVHTAFMKSLMLMDHVGEVSYAIECGSLIYDSRNKLLVRALNTDADRMLWLDSDIDFKSDLMQKLSDDLDSGFDIVSGLYFKRRPPFSPVIYKECEIKRNDGLFAPTASTYDDYPGDEIFPVAACGFGCVMMNMDAVRKIVQKNGSFLFMPTAGFGEDLSFCMRARDAGVQIYCDSSIKLGHVGYKTYTEEEFNHVK